MYLLQKYNGQTPANYFREFKRAIKAGKRSGYFVETPVEDIQSKENFNRKRKEVLESDEWARLVQTPCLNHEIKPAFIFLRPAYTAEQMQDYYRSTRFTQIYASTLILFTNLNSVSAPLTHSYKYIHLAAGAGLRIKFNKHAYTNIAIDDGRNKAYSGIAINLAETF